MNSEASNETLPGVGTGGSRSGSETDPALASERHELVRGAEVGRYVVLAKLGAGSMGVVFAAYDPELDRKVAIKLLRGGVESSTAQSHGRTRLLREAQALGRLNHPNVIAIYDVGTLDGRVWLAMEFFEGQTLSEWLRSGPRWSAVVKVMLAAGRGLEAAHLAGLLHRDFKPDNVMVSHDDRVRVVDFGLARSEGLANARATKDTPDTRANPELAALSLQVTQAGALMGTPRYMAPEQFVNAAVTAAADQYSFAVTLWEALYRERPFRGSTVIELAADVLSGRKPQPPRGASVPNVPGWLRRICERGLASRPEHRYPSLGAMLSELERGQSRARVRVGAGIVAGALSLGLGVAFVDHWQATARTHACERAGATIWASWNDDVRERVRAGLLGSGASYAQTVPDTVAPWLDRQAQAWAQARTQVCLHESVEHSWDAQTSDRATWCLDERRLEFDALISAFEHADATIVQRAVAAAAGLGPIAACTDPKSLALAPAPPPPEARQAIADARAGLAAATALKLGGKYPEALARALEVNALDSVSSWPPLHAASLRLQGEMQSRTGAYVEAEASLTRAFMIAVGVDDWSTAAQAASDLIHAVGVGQTRHAEGRLWASFAVLAIERAGDPLGMREANRLSVLGLLETSQGNYAQAKSYGEQAVARYEAALGPHHLDLAASLGLLTNTLYALGEYPRVREIQSRVLEIRRANLSPGHPDIASSLNTLGAVSFATGDYDTAIALYQQAVDIRQAALGPNHLDVAASLTNLCLAYRSKGMLAEAKQAGERALAIQERAGGPEHPMVAAGLTNLGGVLSALGETEESNRLSLRALAIYEKAYGPEHPLVATSLKNVGTSFIAQGEYDRGLAMLERSLAIREKTLGPNHPDVGSVLFSLAHLHAEQGHEAEALPLLERAIAIYDATQGDQVNEGEARWLLARVLVASAQDPARALEQARLARKRAATGGDANMLAKIDEFLATRGGP